MLNSRILILHLRCANRLKLFARFLFKRFARLRKFEVLGHRVQLLRKDLDKTLNKSTSGNPGIQVYSFHTQSVFQGRVIDIPLEMSRSLTSKTK
jgi:hypothetical protein